MDTRLFGQASGQELASALPKPTWAEPQKKKCSPKELRIILIKQQQQQQQSRERAGNVSQLAECPPNPPEVWIQFPALHELGIVVPTCNPSTQEDQQFKVILDYPAYMSSYLRQHCKVPLRVTERGA